MKHLLALLLFLPSFCIGFSEECKEVIIESFCEKQENHDQEAIDMCTVMINDPMTCKRDLIHLYVCRMRLYLKKNNPCRAERDKTWIELLINNYPECRKEFDQFYKDEVILIED